jgi:ribosomal protein S1
MLVKTDVVVLELDVDGRKLSLGHKQTTANPGISMKIFRCWNYPHR